MAKDPAAEIPVKSGFLTTEFWTTAAVIIGNIVAVLAVMAKLSPDQTSELTNAVTQLCTMLPVVAANVFVIWKYISGRTAVKQAAQEAATARYTAGLQADVPAKAKEPSTP